MSQESQIVGAHGAEHSPMSHQAIFSRLVIWSTAALALFGSLAGCARRPATNAVSPGEELFGKMRAGIESVSRGIVRVEDQTPRDDGRPPVTRTFRLVFDDSQKMLRCDLEGPSRMPKGLLRHQTKYARTATESLFQFVEERYTGGIQVGAPDRDFSGTDDQPLEPHLLWFAGVGGYRLRERYSDVMRAWLASARDAKVSRDDAGRLVLSLATRQVIRRLVIDPTLGFVPVRNEVISGTDRPVVIAWTDIRYEKKNGCFVPVSLEIHEAHSPTIKVTCRWESVNAAIDPKLFTAEGFGAPNGTQIWDMRGSLPMDLGVTGPAPPQHRRRPGVVPSAAAQSILNGVKRTILKEPKYVSSPRYALLVFGPKAESRVWMVEDGETLYVDKNANSDLTDDGPPIAPTNTKQFGMLWPNGVQKGAFDYVLGKITLPDGSRQTDFCLRRWNTGATDDGYGLSLKVNGQTEMYAGWTSFWATSPGAAPIIHFGGPLQPRILDLEELRIGRGRRRLSIAFINPGRGEGAQARLSIDALPRKVIPKVQIDWPVEQGAAPLQTSHLLLNRCCDWHFYDPKFEVPRAAVAGTATVTVSLQGGVLPFELAISQIKVPIQAKDSEMARQ